MSAIQLFFVIVDSWKFALFEIPVLFLAYMCFPHNWGGNLLLLTAFILVTLLLFIVFPSSVGERYKEGVYNRILFKLKSIISR